MLEERNIIYFDPFFFKNGNTAKPKYFIVLKRYESNCVIASLPTRKDNIPQNENEKIGCIELPELNLNCFIIPKDFEVTDCGKSFIFKTYLYGHQIDDYKVNLLEELYPNEGSDYQVWGKMKIQVFEDLISCFKNSKSVKRKFKFLL